MKKIFCLKLYHLLVFSIVLFLVSCTGKGGTEVGKMDLAKNDSTGGRPKPLLTGITLSNCFYTLYAATDSFRALPTKTKRMFFTYSFSSTGVPLLNGWSVKTTNDYDPSVPLLSLIAAPSPPLPATDQILIDNTTVFGNMRLGRDALDTIKKHTEKYVVFSPTLKTPGNNSLIGFIITFTNTPPTNVPLTKPGGGVPLKLALTDYDLNPSPPRDY